MLPGRSNSQTRNRHDRMIFREARTSPPLPSLSLQNWNAMVMLRELSTPIPNCAKMAHRYFQYQNSYRECIHVPILEGSVENIVFRNEDNHYTLARFRLNDSGRLFRYALMPIVRT